MQIDEPAAQVPIGKGSGACRSPRVGCQFQSDAHENGLAPIFLFL